MVGPKVAIVQLGLLVLGLGSAPASSSEQPDLELEWNAPASCPDADTVRAQVDAHSTAARRWVRAVATVTQDAERTWHVELRTQTEDGSEHRALQGESCEALARATGLLLAVAGGATPNPQTDPQTSTSKAAPPSPRAADPDPDLDEPDPDPAEPPRAPDPEPVVPPEAPPRSAPSRPLGGYVRAVGVLQLGRVLPRVADGGVGGAVGGAWGPVRLEARARYYAPQRQTYAALPDSGGRFDVWSLGPALCWAPTRARLSFPLCGGAELGRMRGRSFGIDQTGVGRSLFAALTLDASLAFAVARRWAVVGGAQGAFLLRRPTFHVRDQPRLFRAAPATARLHAGLEFRFP